MQQPGQWQFFHGEGESNLDGKSLNQLDTPSDLTIVNDVQALLSIDRGKVLVFDFVAETGLWEYSGEFILGNTVKQHYMLKPASDGRFLYAGYPGAIDVFENSDGNWVSREQRALNDEIQLADLSAMEISPDGNYLITLSRSRGSLGIHSVNKQTGELRLQKVFWADGNNRIPGLTGAYSLSFSPDSRELAVTGSWANAITVFRKNGNSEWVFQQEIQREDEPPLDSLHNPRGIAFGRNGKMLYVTAHISNAIIAFRKSDNSGSWEFNDLFKADSMQSPDGIWLSYQGDELFVACPDSLVSLTIDPEGHFGNHQQVLGNTDNPGFAKVIAIAEQRQSSAKLIASRQHRLSIHHNVKEDAARVSPTPKSGEQTIARTSVLSILLVSTIIWMSLSL